MTNPNDPAFPELKNLDGMKDTLKANIDGGLTKREYVAVMAMQGLVMNAKNGELHNTIANDAVTLADVLIKELSR